MINKAEELTQSLMAAQEHQTYLVSSRKNKRTTKYNKSKRLTRNKA
jgi:hypothetical protein